MTGASEPIVWEFRRAIAPLFVPLDFGIYRSVALLENLPWRAIGLGLLVGPILVLAGKVALGDVDDGLLAFGAFGFLVALMGVELVNRRDVLTPTHFVQQRGILGRKRLRIPLHTIVNVEYHYPRWGEPWNVGDVCIRTDGNEIRLAAVSDAARGAQAILDAKGRLATGAP